MLKAVILVLCASLVYCAAPKGIDVSVRQPNINWNAVKASGVEFAYIKATEGTGYKSPTFSQQYIGATKVSLIRGAYHVALPDRSSGIAQAEYFVKNGGGWSSDGLTLPGAVQMEQNPYGPHCYGLTPSFMVAWIQDFSDTYHATTGRYPVIYTTTGWWIACVGNNGSFGANNPLWISRFAAAVGTLPPGWTYPTFWQHADNGPNQSYQNAFRGDTAGLKRFARG